MCLEIDECQEYFNYVSDLMKVTVIQVRKGQATHCVKLRQFQTNIKDIRKNSDGNQVCLKENVNPASWTVGLLPKLV